MIDAVPFALLRTGLFNGLSEEAFAGVLEHVARMEVAAGAVVVREGEEADAYYVVLTGALEVVTLLPGGGEVVLATIRPGEHFGEQALLPGHDGVRSATVRGAAPMSAVARLERDSLELALSSSPELRTRLDALGKEQLQSGIARRSGLVRALLASPDSHTEEIERENGDVVHRQGEPVAAVHVVLSGHVELFEDRDGLPVRMALVGAGMPVGERDTETHSTTAVVDGSARLLRVPREAFAPLRATNAEVQAHLATLERVHELPQRGFVTQYAGTMDGLPCLTQLYHLADGRRFVCSQMIGASVTLLEAAQGEPSRTIAVHGGALVVALDSSARIHSVVAKGASSATAALFAKAIDGVAITPAEESALVTRGELAAEAGFVCTCLRVRQSAVTAAIAGGAHDLATLQQRTGCGRACGSCLPSLVEMLGESSFFDVTIAKVDELAPGVRRFHLAGDLPAARPGQHVVLRTREGHRPYTLSSAVGEPWHVTVKRKSDGVFSAWLFEHANRGTRLQASRPRGSYVWDGGPAPVACFACGIGITPALSFARTLLREGLPHRLLIDWSVRTEAELPVLGELRQATAANLSIRTRVTSREGRIAKSDVAACVERFPDAAYFLCGTEEYMRDVRAWLLAAGVVDARVRIESFDPPERAPRAVVGAI